MAGRTSIAGDGVVKRIALAVALVASTALFASLDAWRARRVPLAGTAASPEALAAAVVAAMRAGDLDRLRALALTEHEFRTHVWPELPSARPERNMPSDFVWERLQQSSEGHLRQTLTRLGESSFDVRRVQFGGETSDYGDVVVRRKTQLVVRSSDGRESVVQLFGSMIEQNGRYKVFSYVVDD
jgi:hypothetical protein